MMSSLKPDFLVVCVHGCLSCPVCMDTTKAEYLKHSRKILYFRVHRKFLPLDHRYRSLTTEFNGRKETAVAGPRYSGEEVAAWLSSLNLVEYTGKKTKPKRDPQYGKTHNWTHRCMFFELPYWEKLNIRHNLDVMHIEKNCFDNVFNTIMNVKDMTKDNERSRMDMKEMKIRTDLHLREVGGKTVMPRAKYVLTKEQILEVCTWVKALKLPDGYASNISKCCNLADCKFYGMKSHDCHVFMETLIPLAIRDYLPPKVVDAITELCHFFNSLCSTVLSLDALERLDADIRLTMSKLEQILPPSFFDAKEHLPIHLAYEAKMGGPVQYRWMYPFERYMHKMKRKVHNRARVEGSIAELYLVEELAHFCEHYFELRIETALN